MPLPLSSEVGPWASTGSAWSVCRIGAPQYGVEREQCAHHVRTGPQRDTSLAARDVAAFDERVGIEAIGMFFASASTRASDSPCSSGPSRESTSPRRLHLLELSDPVDTFGVVTRAAGRDCSAANTSSNPTVSESAVAISDL